MAGNELKITISAQDNASAVFTKIASGAAKVADELEKAGKDGGKGFEEVSKGADKANQSLLQISQTGSGFIRSMEGLSGSISTMGAGLISLGDGLDQLGQSYIDQQQRLDTLQRQYGSFTDEMVAFSREMQSQTTFSDDAVQKGLVYFASLKEQYGLTIDQIKQLAIVTADLAQANGLAYEDAAQRVQAAIRGETEGAEILGLALNQQSIDRQNLTLTMTNQEAAQFRLNALLSQASYAQGSAGAAVQRADGQWKQFSNSVQDAQQAVGRFVGPAGDIAASLGRGLATVGEATRGISDLKTGLQGLGGVLKSTGSALSVLATSGGAVGLAILGVTAAVGAGVYVWQTYNDAIHSTEKAFDGLDAAQQQAILNGDEARSAAIGQAKQDFEDFGAWLDKEMGVGEYATEGGPKFPGISTDTYDNVLKAVTAALSDSRVDVEKYMAWLEGELQRAYENPAQAQEIFEGIVETSTTGLAQFALAAEKAKTAVSGLNAEQQKLNQSMAQYANMYGQKTDEEWDAAKVKTFNEQVQEAIRLREQMAAAPGEERDLVIAQQRLDLWEKSIVTQEKLNDAWQRGMETGDLSEFIALANQRIAQQQMLLDLQRALNQETAVDHHKGMDPFGKTVDNARDLLKLEDQRQAIAEGVRDVLEGQADAYHDMATTWAGMTGQDDFVSQLNLSGHGTAYTQLAGDIADANTALQDGFRIIVQNTDAIGQTSQATQDWADKLIGVEGEYGKIDDLLAAGTITIGEYNAAQQAQVDIAEANARIQQDVLTIQAKQAPMLAELTEQQAQYMDQLAAMPQQQQLVTLGWMDTNEAAKANQAVVMAAAAANGEYGESGKAAVEKMIAAQAAADPVFKQMLLDIGLIDEKVDANGNRVITVNFDGAEGVNNDIQELTKSIDALTVALGGVPPLHVDSDLPQTTEGVDGFRDSLDGAKRDIGATNDALIALARQQANPTVDVETGESDQRMVNLADALRALGEQHPTPSVEVETGEADGPLDALKQKLDDLELPRRVQVLFDQGEGTGGSPYDPQGPGSAQPEMHVKTVLDPPELPDYSGVPPVPLQSQWDPIPPPDLPTIDPVTIPVQYEFATAADADPLRSPTGIDGPFSAGGDGIRIPVTVEVIGAEQVETLKSDIDGLEDKTVTIMGDATVALGAVSNVNEAAINDKTLTIMGDATLALGAVNNVNGAGIDDKTLTIFGDATLAFAAIENVNNTPVNDKTMTISVVTQYSTVGSPPSGISVARHGGIPAYASGGVVFRGGEAGLELAHFAGGGIAPLPWDGLYMAPAGTRIEPHNSVVTKLQPGGVGGYTVVVNVNAPVFGIDDLEAKIGGAIARSMVEIKQDRDRALGVAA